MIQNGQNPNTNRICLCIFVKVYSALRCFIVVIKVSARNSVWNALRCFIVCDNLVIAILTRGSCKSMCRRK